MARPPPLALGDASAQGDHSDWQVVLSDPSKRRVVLYSRNLNRLSIEPTPPPSPSLSGPRRRRGWRRKSWSGLSSLEGNSSEGEGAVLLHEQAQTQTSSPLARAVRKHGRDADDDEDDEQQRAAPSASSLGGGPSSRQRHSLTDAVPESVCPLCFQILPPPPPSSSSSLSTSTAAATTATTKTTAAAAVVGSASPAAHGRSRNSKQKRTRHKRLFPVLPPPAGFLAADHQSDPGTESDRTTAAESGSSHAVVAGDMNAGTSYFELLSEANSLVNTPMSTGGGGGGGTGGNARIAAAAAESPDRGGKAKDEGLDSHQMNEGYYARFFDEVSLLGESLESYCQGPEESF